MNDKTYDCLNEDFLARCRAITNHYESKKGTWPAKDQILKIYEEVAEIHKAKDYHNLVEECCDTILAVITLLDLVGLPYSKINQVMEKTLQKVESRMK